MENRTCAVIAAMISLLVVSSAAAQYPDPVIHWLTKSQRWYPCPTTPFRSGPHGPARNRPVFKVNGSYSECAQSGPYQTPPYLSHTGASITYYLQLVSDVGPGNCRFQENVGHTCSFNLLRACSKAEPISPPNEKTGFVCHQSVGSNQCEVCMSGETVVS